MGDGGQIFFQNYVTSFMDVPLRKHTHHDSKVTFRIGTGFLALIECFKDVNSFGQIIVTNKICHMFSERPLVLNVCI